MSGGDVTEWVPASCTLPAAEQPLRVAEFDGLFAAHLIGTARPAETVLRLTLEAASGVEARTRELVRRESDCCSFFTFTVALRGDRVVVDVAVDAAHRTVLDALHLRLEPTAAGVVPGAAPGAGPEA